MKHFLLPFFIAVFFVAGAQTKSIKIPPNRDTVLVISTTTTTIIPATVTTTNVLTSQVLPTDPGNPPPGTGGELQLNFSTETAYYERPFAGVENWNGQDYASIPNAVNPAKRLDYYFRFLWTQLEGQTINSYNWLVFDREINRAITNGQKFSFGIMLLCPGGCDPFNQPVFYGGSSSGYPLYLHNLMQAEPVKDAIINGTWIPAWNSNNLLSRIDALNIAINNHLNTTSFNGVLYKNVINYIDIRFMGSYGEWNHAGIVDPLSNYPAGMRPVVSAYKRIIDSHIIAFPDIQLVMLLAALDAERLNNTLTPVEVTNYALNVRNNKALLGIRADQQGSLQWNNADNYVRQYMENNNKSWNGGAVFSTLTMSRYKFAPLVGEPENNSDNPQLQTLVAEAQLYHRNSVGNGNFTRSAAADQYMRNAASIMGFRLNITGGKIAYSTAAVSVSLNWQNIGLVPVYEKWNTILEMVNSSGTVIKTVVSSFNPTLFLPAAGSTTFVDNMGSAVPGSYTIKLTVKDPNNYRAPLPLNIKGRSADGSYTLGSFTVVSAP